VALCDVRGDRESEPGPLNVLAAVKTVEGGLDIFVGNAGAVVDDFESRATAATRQNEVHLAALRRVGVALSSRFLSGVLKPCASAIASQAPSCASGPPRFRIRRIDTLCKTFHRLGDPSSGRRPAFS
jgi:hypothetical protein